MVKRRMPDNTLLIEDYAFPTYEELRAAFAGMVLPALSLTIVPIYPTMTIPNPDGTDFGEAVPT